MILVDTGYYYSFSLSYHDASEILKERGISVHPTTNMRWIHEYGDLIYKIWKVKNFGEPTVLTTDKAPALLCSFNKLRKQGLFQTTIHYMIKYSNNIIEQEHFHLKRWFAKSAGFQNLHYVSITIKDIETIYALYKQKRSLQIDSAFSTYNEPRQLPYIT
ncbi:DDE-type integrase/transposase/recombinase [Bacillus toyonensis]|uniref:DDE-type integrase/transposase/recombinase n=1 Tax=Bacillus toyonensis TaxID=155322 RepID=UPI00211D2DDE|nr:DDE-type integrase/transposase/recombinase [Bacillus toyonensis]